jgi:Zn-dependent membrane protease YugP
MALLGLVLLIIGLVATMHVLVVVGVILLIVGLLFNFAPGPWVGSGTTRRRYW